MKAFILALETSSPLLSIALAKNTEAIKEVSLQGFYTHAENLIPSIDRLLKKNKVRLKDLDRILIGRGPGSFTGLRVGFATLKAIHLLYSVPVWGASSLDIIASQTDIPVGSKLAVCLDAHKQKIYVRYYQKKKTWIALGKANVTDLGSFFEIASEATPPRNDGVFCSPSRDVIARRPKADAGWSSGGRPPVHPAPSGRLGEAIYIIGNTLERYSQEFKKQVHKKILFLPEESWYPKASSLIQMDFAKSQFLKPLTTPRDFLPLYLRRSEAEERKKEHVACH